MKHIELLKSLEVCDDVIEWAKGYDSLEPAWENCKHSDWMLRLDLEMDLFTDKERRLMACRFLRETPIGDRRTVWVLLGDERSRNAVIIAEKFANGEATQQELDATGDAAGVAASYAASADAWVAAWNASVAAKRYAARYAGDAALAAVNAAQSDIIHSYGNPFNGNEVKV